MKNMDWAAMLVTGFMIGVVTIPFYIFWPELLATLGNYVALFFALSSWVSSVVAHAVVKNFLDK